MVQVTQSVFGSFTDPQTGKKSDVVKFTLTAGKVSVDILNYGGIIAAIRVPDSNGRIEDVALGFDTFDEYLAPNNPYFGAIVGRVANRVGGAKFTLNGQQYKVTANRAPNSLHGGLRGFDKVIWKSNVEDNKLVLTYISKDGEEGYPGDVWVTAIYSLSSEGHLTLDMRAFASKPTPINLTNHSYFNLAGNGTNKAGVYEHLISVNADKYTVTDKDSIPTGQLAPVGGTLWDLRIPRKLGDVTPLVAGTTVNGYDQNLCIIRGSEQGLTFVARVVHIESSRTLEVYSNQPGVQLYTANYFPKDTRDDPPSQLSVVQDPLIGKNKVSYYQHGAFCLETQNYPDAVNQPNFPNSILVPGETYNHVVVYKFGVSPETGRDVNSKYDVEP